MSSLIEVLNLYWWTFLSALVAAPALALIGAQILARGWSTRALIVSQGSSTGMLIGLAVLSWLQIPSGVSAYVGILIASVVFSALVGALLLVLDRTQSRRALTPDPASAAFLFSVYVGLISIGGLLTSLSPHLETSMTAALIGDLSTASNLEARLGLAVSLGLLGWLWLQWQTLTHDAFRETVLAKVSNQKRQAWFAVVSMLALAVAMQSMGFIFVVGGLFVPNAMIGKRHSNLGRYRIELVFTAVVGTAIGFALSLSSSVLPTAPTIIVSQIVIGLLVRITRRRAHS